MRFHTHNRGVPTLIIPLITELLYRPRFKSISKRLPTLTTAQRWAIAAGGNLAKINSSNFDYLHNGHSRRGMKFMLKRWWGVKNGPETHEILRWLMQEGHRAEFNTIFAQLAPLPPDQFAAKMRQFDPQRPMDALRQQHFTFIYENRQYLANGGLVSWDMGRLINICRGAYVTGYLSEQEAWAYIMPAARAIQQAYHSWSEVSTGYLLGWRYWQHGKPTERFYIEQAEWLKTNPASPWQQLAWDTPLG